MLEDKRKVAHLNTNLASFLLPSELEHLERQSVLLMKTAAAGKNMGIYIYIYIYIFVNPFKPVCPPIDLNITGRLLLERLTRFYSESDRLRNNAFGTAQ